MSEQEFEHQPLSVSDFKTLGEEKFLNGDRIRIWEARVLWQLPASIRLRPAPLTWLEQAKLREIPRDGGVLPPVWMSEGLVRPETVLCVRRVRGLCCCKLGLIVIRAGRC